MGDVHNPSVYKGLWGYEKLWEMPNTFPHNEELGQIKLSVTYSKSESLKRLIV